MSRGCSASSTRPGPWPGNAHKKTDLGYRPYIPEYMKWGVCFFVQRKVYFRRGEKKYILMTEAPMEMTTVQLKVPVAMEPYIATKPDGELVQLALLLHPFVKNETISHGRAAEILGITKWQLIELYANEGFAYFDMDWSEVEEDVATYERLKAKEAAQV